jgi:hypothetical protein
MLKKILFGMLMIGLISILVAGAAIRTADRATKATTDYDRLEGRDGEVAAQGNGGRLESMNLGAGGGWQDSENSVLSAGASRRLGGNGPGGRGSSGAVAGEGEAEVDEWITLAGNVSHVDESSMAMVTLLNETVTIENRPWLFAVREGFLAQAGDKIRLLGFYEDGEPKVGAMENLTSGSAVRIREDGGRPLWVGRSRDGA